MAALPRLEYLQMQKPRGVRNRSVVRDKFRYVESGEMWKREKSAHWPHGGVNQHPAGGLLTPCTCVCPESKPSVFPPIIWASNAVYLRRFLRHVSILVPDVQDPLEV